MTRLRHRLRSFVWMALLAIGGVTFGPSISRALEPAATGSAGVQMHAMDMDATAQMPAEVEPESDSEDDSDCHSHPLCLLDCCALCAIAATPFTGTDTVVAICLPPLESATHPQPSRSSAGPDRHQRWSSAAPRGPPSVC